MDNWKRQYRCKRCGDKEIFSPLGNQSKFKEIHRNFLIKEGKIPQGVMVKISGFAHWCKDGNIGMLEVIGAVKD